MKKLKRETTIYCPEHQIACSPTDKPNYWSCMLCREGSVLTTLKYLEKNHCNDCGKKFIPRLTKEILAYQVKHMTNHSVRVSCDECIAKGHTITDEELQGTKRTKVKVRN